MDNIESREEPPLIEYKWRNITVKIKNKHNVIRRIFKKKTDCEKYLLNNVSGKAHSRKLYALIGPSGAGKTTFLNVLSGNMSSKYKADGELLLNGQEVEIRQVSAYVQQEDIFFIHFTVYEYMKFLFRLNFGRTLSGQKLETKITNMLEKFNLAHITNSIIGDGINVRGISGGERKRLSIASEMIKKPKIIFADEPTSGLDTNMAINVIKLLKETATENRIVIATIHQPCSQILDLFDE